MAAKSNRAPWMGVALAACLGICFFGISAGAGAYFHFIATPSSTPRNAATTPTARPTKSLVDLPKDKATCEAQGGKWGRIGLAPTESCNLPTSDGGQVCSDSSECEGLCIADLSPADRDRLIRNKVTIETKGRCARWRITVGCIPLVAEGKVKAILCLD
ncbi:MAG: hypothetical protein KGJ80_12035 [Chloroflexota bacterium]|nr:hypothetical protein [Chloroflexota bacterium]